VAVVHSARLFAWGILRRFYLWLSQGFLAALEAYERATGRGVDVDIPEWAIYSAFVGGLLIAAFLTYHELRTTARDQPRIQVQSGGIYVQEAQSVTLGVGRRPTVRTVSKKASPTQEPLWRALGDDE
jgi:hypothetical protein